MHDRDELAALLRRDPALHAYELGDLDDEFWPQTTWYRHGDAVALLYHGTSLPTLIALDPPTRLPELTALIVAAVPLLPARFHAHLSTGAETGLVAGYDLHQVSGHLKMSLTDPGLLPPEPADGDVLGAADLPELLEFYDAAYPQHWFEPGMLAKGPYLGIRRDGELVAVCGDARLVPCVRGGGDRQRRGAAGRTRAGARPDGGRPMVPARRRAGGADRPERPRRQRRGGGALPAARVQRRRRVRRTARDQPPGARDPALTTGRRVPGRRVPGAECQPPGAGCRVPGL